MLSKTTLASAMSLALITGVAGASPGEYERHEYYEHRGPMPFEVIDLNRDGVVTADEHAQVRSERHAVRAQQGYPMRNAGSAPSFEQMDSDSNGSISRDELAEFQALRMQQRQGMSRR
jgi:Ca2+-binding EF-hand superfamily protein